MDSILRREVVIITLQMSLFRNNISQRLMLDESTSDDTGLDMSNMQIGFKEGCVERTGKTL